MMEIYGRSLGNRFGSLMDVDKAPHPRPAHLLVWHWEQRPEEVVDFLQVWRPDDPDERCRALLVVKGIHCGGFDPRTATELEDRHRGRLHFLRYAVPDQIRNAMIRQKFDRFAEVVKTLSPDAVVPWNLIDEQWPENLLAVYLALRAITALTDAGSRSRIARGVPGYIRDQAVEEFRSRGGENWSGAMSPVPEEANALANIIATVLPTE